MRAPLIEEVRIDEALIVALPIVEAFIGVASATWAGVWVWVPLQSVWVQQ
jgi:hypothetical protein